MRSPAKPDPDLAVLWASLPVPALVIGASGLIGAANPAAESFLNASVKSLTGQSLRDRLATDADIETALVRVRRNQAALLIRDAAVTTGGRAPVACNIQLAPMQDGSDTVLMLILAHDPADRVGRAMPVKRGAASAIGMAEMLAHEIKNPLAGISGAAQLISMNASPDDRELAGLIVEETRRIVKLLDQVDPFGTLHRPDMRAVNLHDALDRARRSALVGFAARMTILQDYDPSLPPTFADSDQLMQVFLNLIRNASEAATRPGTIRLRSYYDQTLRLRRADGSFARLPLTVEVQDDGPGIPPAIAADIFDPFVSGRENGSGLGLALVSRIIADHGGWITVDSVPGRTVFRVSLPVAAKDALPCTRG